MAERHHDVAASYLEQLTDGDLALLAAAVPGRVAGADPVGSLRSAPGLVLELLEHRASFEAVFASLDDESSFAFVSPFLIFSLCVARTAAELAQATYVTEWFGPRRRTPVFDVADLREFLSEPERQLFLVELLASYTHVASGSVLVRTARGMRRQRFSELDPIRLAALIDVIPSHDRPGVYRRLGDLALFLTGVFPDHTALHPLSQLDRIRLLRASGARPERIRELAASDLGVVELLERLGPRWYRFAADGEHRFELVGAERAEGVLSELARSFGVARRILNVVTDSFLFPFRSRVFGLGA